MSYLVAYAVCALVMAALDAIWLSQMARPVYYRANGAVMADKPNMMAAGVFYLLYIAGILVFAVGPALAALDWRVATLQGALFGFLAFATYDLTNLATLKVWSLPVALMDMAWGTFLTGATATAGAMAALAVTG